MTNLGWSQSGPSVTITKSDLQCVSTNKLYVTFIFIVVFYIPIIIMGFLYVKIIKIAHQHLKSIKRLHKNVLSRRSSQFSRELPLSSESPGYWSTFNCYSCSQQTEVPSNTTSNCGISGEEKPDGNFVVEYRERDSITVRPTHCSGSSSAGKVNSMAKATKTVAVVCGCFLVCWLPVSIQAIGLAWWNESFETAHGVGPIVIVDVLPVLNSTLNPFVYFIVNKTYRKALKRICKSVRNKAQALYYDSLVFGSQ